MNGFDLDPFVDWFGTFALHSTCALGAALLVSMLLRGRALAWQERLLRFSLWAPVLSSTVQFLVLGGPWTGGFSRTPPIERVLSARLLPFDEALHDSEPVVAMAPELPWWTPTLVVAALAAAAAVGGLWWLWRSHRRLGALLARRRPEQGPRVLAAAASVARRLGLRTLPRLSRCDLLPTPVAFGLWRPEVCLPSRAGELGSASLQAMLAHELAHLRRRDPAVMAMGTLLQALFPWQLLLPIVRRRWLRLVELRCDAIAAGHTSPTAVARCLLEVAEWLRSPQAHAMPALAMAARPSALRDRVEAALRHRAAPPPRRWLSFAFGGVSLSALTLAGPGLHAAPDVASPPADTRVVVLDELSSPAALLKVALAERASLVAEAAQLKADLAGRAISPELEQLLLALQRRLLAVERLATRIELRLESRGTEAR